MELFVFTDNLVFESVFYKGGSEILFLFELFLRLHKVHMIGYMIQRVIITVGTRIIEAGIDGISRRNRM